MWNKKPDKIKREIKVQKLEHGELNMRDIEHIITSLKILWIRRVHQGNATLRLLILQDLPLFGLDYTMGPTIFFNNCAAAATRKTSFGKLS